MPVAAKLSRKLYDTLGPEAAEAMVDWMQNVESHRTELRELYDLGFARIDSRFSQAQAELDLRFAHVDARFSQARSEIDLRFARVDSRFVEASAEIGQMREQMQTGFAQLETKLERRFADLVKWSFVFWVGSTVTLVAALAALGRIGR